MPSSSMIGEGAGWEPTAARRVAQVLRFDASDLGGKEGELPVFEAGDAGDARPSCAGLKFE